MRPLFAYRNFSSATRSSSILHDILRVSPNYTNTQLKHAYLQRCRDTHPDVNNGKTLQFLEVQKAYEYLRNHADDYKNLTSDEYGKFVEIWKNEFDTGKEKHIDFDLKMQQIGFKSDSRFKQLVVTTVKKRNNVKNYKNKHEIYKKYSLNTSAYYKAAYFILDTSASMYWWKNGALDKYIVSSESDYRDGKNYSAVEIKSGYEYLIDPYRYISQCLTSIANIAIQLQKTFAQSYYLRVFGGTNKLFAENNNAARFSYILSYPINKYKIDDDKTHIYDAIRNSINDINDDLLPQTLFVCLTDGTDTGSGTSLTQLVNMIKIKGCINIIVMALHLEDVDNLRQIVSAATFGKLMQIGDKYEFASIEQAYSNIKDIMIIPNQESHVDANFFNIFH